MKRFFFFSCFALLFLTGCEESNYNGGGGWYPPSSSPYGYGGSYDRGYDRGYNGGYDRDHDYDRDHNRCGRDRDHGRCGRDHDRCSGNRCSGNRCGSGRDNRNDTRPPQPRPTPPPQEQIIRPSCPSDTTFDGRHCIVDPSKRRKGGKGTINACPSGMYLSGDRCVKN